LQEAKGPQVMSTNPFPCIQKKSNPNVICSKSFLCGLTINILTEADDNK